MPAPVTRRLCYGLLLAALLLFALHCVTSLSWSLSRQMAPAVRAVVDLTSETSLFSWLSVMVWALVGVACFGQAGLEHRWRWALSGSLFVLLSVDDASMLHELSGHLLYEQTRETGIYPWLFATGPVFAVLGLLLFVHLWNTVGRAPSGRLWIALGFALLALAVGLEALEGPITRAGWTWRGMPGYRYTQPVEELVELLGPLCLFRAIAGPLEARLRGRMAENASERGAG